MRPPRFYRGIRGSQSAGLEFGAGNLEMSALLGPSRMGSAGRRITIYFGNSGTPSAICRAVSDVVLSDALVSVPCHLLRYYSIGVWAPFGGIEH